MSPSSVKQERMGELSSYAYYEIPEYWLIDPIQKYLEQYELKEGQYLLYKMYTEDQQLTHLIFRVFPSQ
ncbi:Uma2 family endonuclease [Oceanobacillus limi]|uniref:Uma2 family endonuclease n=1 Tax=Oceanobacillus limi TaxID=930131 RepID=UPI000B858B4D|nr:Uma2 family endonuclease [Oceanobacillus limi]